MSIDTLIKFIESTPTDLASAWDFGKVVDMASRRLPENFMGDQEALLMGDQYRLWLRWFLEGLVSPNRAAIDTKAGHLEILASVMARINALHASTELDRRAKLAEAVTAHIFSRVTHLRNAHERDYATAATRHALIAESSTPRCYICGYAFSKEAREAFLRVKGREKVALPAFVDVFRPRGLADRDEKIEIEHIVPVAEGGSGQANLRLACGWCNKHKSDRVSIYESSFMAPRTTAYKIGKYQLNELPNPFWSIRILALRGKCQHVGGCSHTAASSELFVSLIDWLGSPNPTNLAVYCEIHDPIRVDRRQARADVEKLWQERRR